ncbi:MAG: peptide ABC transporter substrate-binding protein [Deltaproteobacteria bacterium]|nr:peptide ABC transporter substrate-binding protein [Deltaproteobacteria bacterium]
MRSTAFVILFFCLLPNALAEVDFKVRLLDDPVYFDWNLAYGNETPILMNVMEGLVELDTGSAMHVRPQLAESWTVSKDGKTYLFKLRPNVKWSDGRALTAADFSYSWLRLLHPGLGATYAYYLFDIEGAEDYHKGRLKNPAGVGIRAIGKDQLEVRLRVAKPFFPQLLSFWVTFPVRRDLVENFGVKWAHPGNVAVLGPFVPTAYVPHSSVVLKRNELYHGLRPKLDTVTFKIINEESQAIKAFAKGEIDYTPYFGTTAELAEVKLLTAIRTAPYYQVCSAYFNVSIYPFSLPKVRQAFATIGDVARLPKMELTVYASDELARVATKITELLSRNLGIKISVSNAIQAEYFNRVRIGMAPFYYGCWAADYADPDSFFGIFLSDIENNTTRWKSASYDTLVKQAATMLDPLARAKKYTEALRLLLRDEVPVIPLYSPPLRYLLKSGFSGFKISPLNYAFFRDISASSAASTR